MVATTHPTVISCSTRPTTTIPVNREEAKVEGAESNSHVASSKGTKVEVVHSDESTSPDFCRCFRASHA